MTAQQLFDHLGLSVDGLRQEVAGALIAAGVIGVGSLFVGGLIELMKRLSGRKLKAQKTKEGYITVTLEDGTTVVIPEEVFRLYNDPLVRKALKKLVSPLETRGIHGMETRDADGKVGVRVGKEDISAFDEFPEPEPISQSETEVMLQLHTVPLEGDRQWGFLDGENRINARILDEAFARRMERCEVRFGRRDTFLVILRQTQWLGKDDKLNSRHEVVKVIEHRTAQGTDESPRQQQLPIESPPSPEGE